MTAIPSDTAGWFAAYPSDQGEAGDAIGHAVSCPCSKCVGGDRTGDLNKAFREGVHVEPTKGGE